MYQISINQYRSYSSWSSRLPPLSSSSSLSMPRSSKSSSRSSRSKPPPSFPYFSVISVNLVVASSPLWPSLSVCNLARYLKKVRRLLSGKAFSSIWRSCSALASSRGVGTHSSPSLPHLAHFPDLLTHGAHLIWYACLTTFSRQSTHLEGAVRGLYLPYFIFH